LDSQEVLALVTTVSLEFQSRTACQDTGMLDRVVGEEIMLLKKKGRY